MIGEILEEVVESAEVGPGSRWSQTLVRMLFGVLGICLAAVGCQQVLFAELAGTGRHLQLVGALLFATLGAFCLFNVVLHRAYRWPGRAFLLSLVALFIARIALGP